MPTPPCHVSGGSAGRAPNRGEIQLADLILALARLQPDSAAQAEQIARSLGFGLSPQDFTATAQENRRIHAPGRQSAPIPAAQKVAKVPPGFAAGRPPAPTVPLPALTLPARLQAEEQPPVSGDTSPPAWITADYQRLEPQRAAPLPRQPLFPQRTVRGVLGAMLPTWRAGQRLDVDALIAGVAHGRLPRTPPRLPSTTLARGCQLLLDFSDSMLPWWDDLRQLGAQFAALLGAERVALYDFERSPAEASRWPEGAAEPLLWQPEPGRPVVVATGFGLPGTRSRPLAGREWQPFVRRCASSASPLRILIPWSSAHWPRDLGAHAHLIHWSPQTSAALLLRRLDGLRQPPR